MPRFLAGFLAATLVWGGIVGAHVAGVIEIKALSGPNEEEEDPGAPLEAIEELDEPGKKKRGRTRKGTRRDPRYAGSSTSGDDLGGPGVRQLSADQAGSEEQLLGSEIEAGFDGVFPQVRRCLMLAAGDEPVTGKLVFGMRVTGKGGVERVNLQGPSALTQGEAGDCLRRAAKGIRFRSFNGPDMVIHYPLSLQ